MSNWLHKLKSGIKKSSGKLADSLDDIIHKSKLDSQTLDELEEALITSDIGVKASAQIIGNFRSQKFSEHDISKIKSKLAENIENILSPCEQDFAINKPDAFPFVILMVGVNGAGKTTTIGKLAYQLKKEGHDVVIAAADTFRAAAIDQLKVWAERSGATFVAHAEGSDPGAVVYDAADITHSRWADILLVDTAGRLQNKKNLMEELRKIGKILEREFPTAHREVLLVLDATTGQNALSQARLFKEVAPISGIVLTKLDGTAKGGVVIGIIGELGIPVKYIGVGEGIDDLRPFDPDAFASALFSLDDYHPLETEDAAD